MPTAVSAVRSTAPVSATPMKADRKIASPTTRCTSSLSPLAFAAATRGVVIVGTNETSQNADENTWLAAAWPAVASASPIRPTQKRSTACVIGTRKLTIAGTASATIFLSSTSP